MFLLFAALICADCHKSIDERYARSPMANSSGIVQPSQEHAGRVDTRYVITSGMRLQWPGGSVDLTSFIGSRRLGRSYLYSRDGHLYQVPVGYYATRQAWDLAPGYEKDTAPDLNRPITPACLFCHATSAPPEPGAVNRYASIVHGIGCQRCHGEPSRHEQLVNPAELPPRLRDSVCEQCHLSGQVRLVRSGKKLDDFRPGQDLADYLEVFTGGATRPGVRVNGHAETLASSRCKQASGDRLWCGTCHSPHRTINVAAACQECHSRPHTREECTSCHMPKAKAYDGGHTVFTDHSISTKPRAEPLRSYFSRTPSGRDLGLALVEIAALQRKPEMLQQAWPLLREAAASKPKDPALYAAIGGLLQADGRRQQAIEYYRLSLSMDPVQPEVLHRLAGLLGNSAESRQLRERALRMLPRPFPSR